MADTLVTVSLIKMYLKLGILGNQNTVTYNAYATIIKLTCSVLMLKGRGVFFQLI